MIFTNFASMAEPPEILDFIGALKSRLYNNSTLYTIIHVRWYK